MKQILFIISIILGQVIYQLLSGGFDFNGAIKISYFMCVGALIYTTIFNRKWNE